MHRTGTVAPAPAGFSLTVTDRLEEVRDALGTLAPLARNVFGTWEWQETWWRHFGRGRRLLLGDCRVAGRTRAVLPLYQASVRPLRVVRFLGARHADQLGPVCAPGDRALAAAGVRRLLAGHRRWDLFLAERLLGDEGWPAALAAAPVRHEPSPVVDLGTSDWDEFLATRSSNFRQQARKLERRLVRDRGLEYRLADDPAGLDADMETMFDLHARRWGHGASEFIQPASRAFHTDFARIALERGWLRLWVASLDGRPAAAWYGFRYANLDWFYQQGRAPDEEHSSVGFVLTVHTLREAIRDGVAEYRFLSGGEEYKSRFATRDTGLEDVAVARNLAGRAGSAMVRAVADHPRVRIPLERALLG